MTFDLTRKQGWVVCMVQTTTKIQIMFIPCTFSLIIINIYIYIKEVIFALVKIALPVWILFHHCLKSLQETAMPWTHLLRRKHCWRLP